MKRALTSFARAAKGMDQPFLSAFRKNINDQPEALRPVLAAFDVFQLPLPLADEFVEGTSCLLLFLNNYGLVMRFDTLRDGVPPPDHPQVLRPVWMLNQYGVRIELLPGVRPSGDSEVAHDLSMDLEGEGVVFEDVKGENVGYLPGLDFPVVLDRGAFTRKYTRPRDSRMRPGMNDVKNLKNISPSDVQAAFYRPLYDMAVACLPKSGKGWDRAVDTAQPEKVSRFLEFCAEEISIYRRGGLGLLENNWSGSGWLERPIGKGLEGERTGTVYNQRLAKLRPRI